MFCTLKALTWFYMESWICVRVRTCMCVSLYLSLSVSLSIHPSLLFFVAFSTSLPLQFYVVTPPLSQAPISPRSALIFLLRSFKLFSCCFWDVKHSRDVWRRESALHAHEYPIETFAHLKLIFIWMQWDRILKKTSISSSLSIHVW